MFRTFLRRRAFVKKIDALSKSLLLEEGSPYKIGRELWSTSFRLASDKKITDMSWPLWLIWGALTDGIDGPYGKDPEHIIEIESKMRRAAKEWLLVSSHKGKRNQYFDRWVYEECGYERK
jgi:hypothetical protein